MKALDLFCCAGGATRGLQRAGFHVTGVDIKAQPRYVGDEFIQADALNCGLGMGVGQVDLTQFDFIHASPPCQGYTAMRHAPGAKGAPLLIGDVRTMLQASGVPYCIENVECEEVRRAMRNPIRLCGSMFGLGAQGCQLQRHRLFECSFPVRQLQCNHNDDLPVIGVYGGHARRRASSAGGRGTRDVWEGGHKRAASGALRIDWMTLAELSEAIPPDYSEYIAQAWKRSKWAAA